MVKVYTCTMNLAIDLFIETDVLDPDVVIGQMMMIFRLMEKG